MLDREGGELVSGHCAGEKESENEAPFETPRLGPQCRMAVARRQRSSRRQGGLLAMHCRAHRARLPPSARAASHSPAALLWESNRLKADFYSAGGQEIELYSCTPDIEITRRHALFSRI